MSVFFPIHHAGTADEVAQQIEGLILQGVLNAGDRLPGERELAAETGVSRPVVRQAIKTLEAAGLLVSRHGGGTFVGDVIGTVFAPQVSRLLCGHDLATHDYLEYRREIETVAAGLAAERATGADRDLLRALIGRMEAAYDKGQLHREAEVDIEFHSLVGEMAHNVVLLHTLRSCYRLLSEGIFRNREKLYQVADARRALYRQHRAIADAILEGDSDAARKAARAHIDYVIEATGDLERRQDRERISGLRLARQEASA